MKVSEETNEFADSDMSDNDDFIAYPNSPKIPKWSENTIHAAVELAGNFSDPRRTRSQFESALCMKDPLFAEKCYLMFESDPYTYEYAAHYPIWQTAMKEEFSSLQKNNTWELVDLPPRRKLVQCKWVFKTKFAADGSPLKYNEILVSKGYSHIHGIDYNETFALVAKMDSIRLALTIAASKQWEVHHMDVNYAFLNKYLTKYIYM